MYFFIDMFFFIRGIGWNVGCLNVFNYKDNGNDIIRNRNVKISIMFVVL